MKRSFGLDLIRTLAALLVIIVHAFLHEQYYSAKMDNFMIYLLSYIRNFAFICVPLFMILTGYCKSNKKMDQKHFKSIKNIILVYLIISLICIPFKMYYLKTSDSLKDLVIGIFRFSTNNYAWYVEMYIGLFLLIPFINSGYHNLESKKKKEYLMILLLGICSIPPTFQEITIGNTNLNLFPSWWFNIYPILYYVIGLYIKEYQPKIKKSILLLVIFLTLFLQTTLNYFQSSTNLVVSTSYQNIFTVIVATSIFLLFYQVKIHGKKIRKITERVSKESLGIYLFSFIFDSIFYNKIVWNSTINKNIILSILIIVPLVFISSLISSICITKIIEWSTKIIEKIKEKHKKKYNEEAY